MNREIDRAIDICGSQSDLARRIGVKQQHVWNWLNRDKKVPVQRAIDIEKATNGMVTREQLRPDIFCRSDDHNQVA